MNVIVTLVIVLLICAGLGALAGLVWGTLKFARMVAPEIKQGLKNTGSEMREAARKGREQGRRDYERVFDKTE